MKVVSPPKTIVFNYFIGITWIRSFRWTNISYVYMFSLYHCISEEKRYFMGHPQLWMKRQEMAMIPMYILLGSVSQNFRNNHMSCILESDHCQNGAHLSHYSILEAQIFLRVFSPNLHLFLFLLLNFFVHLEKKKYYHASEIEDM